MMKLVLSPKLAAFLPLAFVCTAAAQIQIHPLPDRPAAKVLPLGALALTAQDADAWIGARMSLAIDKHGFGGAAVVVVKDGQILLSRGYGRAGPAKNLPVDPARTLFPLGAISQALTATAVMQQVAQGHLDLDVDINRYLDFSVPPREGRPLTLRDLLTNASGFDALQRGAAGTDIVAKCVKCGLGSWIKRALPLRVRPAGEVPAASDYAVALAGYIVQRVSGQPFAAYVQQHVFDVLGMEHASFAQPLPAPPVGAAKVYALPMPRAAPAQGLVASVTDMAPFMIAVLQNGHDGRAQILDFDTAKAMLGYARSFAPGLPQAGLGFVQVDRHGQRLLVQRGDLPGFHNAMLLLPRENAGILVAVAGTSDGHLSRALAAEFARRYFPPLPQQRSATLDTARAHGALLVGRYASSLQPLDSWRSLGNLWHQGRIDMAADGSLVTSIFPDAAGLPRRWREVQPFQWQDDAGAGVLGARMEQGRVRWVSVDTLMPREAFVPVAVERAARGNLSVMAAVLLAFVLTGALWLLPAVRRADARLSTSARRWVIGSRLSAVGFLLVAAGWWLALTHVATAGLDAWLRLLQMIAVLAVMSVLAVIGNAVLSWREPGQAWRKVHASALLLASAGALWFVLGYHLLSLRLH